MKLTPKAQEDRDDFEMLVCAGYACTCHMTPPCGLCTHPGNPMNQDERPEAWEDGDSDE